MNIAYACMCARVFTEAKIQKMCVVCGLRGFFYLTLHDLCVKKVEVRRKKERGMRLGSRLSLTLCAEKLCKQ